MAENKMLFLPVMVFGIGATIKSFGIMSENNISAGMAYISIIAILIFLLASYFIYLKTEKIFLVK